MKPGRSSSSENSHKAALPLKNYHFDFGLGSSSSSQPPSSLKEQKQTSLASSARSSSLPSPSTGTSSWAPQFSAPVANPSKSLQGVGSWTQVGGQGSQSMVGDITGKSWARADALKAGGSGVLGGVGSSKADMFGDLLGNAFSHSAAPPLKPSSSSPAKSSSSLPLKPMSAPLKPSSSSQTSAFSTSALSSALPKGPSLKESMTSKTTPPSFPTHNAGIGRPQPTSADADGFGDFFGSASKTTAFNLFPSSSHGRQEKPINADPFDFLQGQASACGAPINSVPAGGEGLKQSNSAAGDDLLGMGFMPDPGSSVRFNPNPPPSQANHAPDLLSDMFGSGASTAFDPIASMFNSQKPPIQKKQEDPLEALWSRSTSTIPMQPVKTADDWGIEDNIALGTEETAATTELESLPPPPAGVNVSIAKEKGVEYYRQGQYPDAIKWLTWAVSMCDSSGSSARLSEILTCRVSCYKEVGEYKKAVEDCSRVLETNPSDTDVLLQRAFLYENMEKYKLGVADLREVVKRDPSNRVASNTLSRLMKMLQNS